MPNKAAHGIFNIVAKGDLPPAQNLPPQWRDNTPVIESIFYPFDL